MTGVRHAVRPRRAGGTDTGCRQRSRPLPFCLRASNPGGQAEPASEKDPTDDGTREQSHEKKGTEPMVSAVAPPNTRDLRVESIRPLIPPAILLEELPLTADEALKVSRSRDEVSRILQGED